MSKSARSAWVGLLALILGLTPAITSIARAADVPAVVNQLPDGAPLFIAIPNLKGFSDKITMLDQQLGLNQPELQDVLGMAKAMLNLNQGLRDTGGAAIVVTSLPERFDAGPPSVAILVPITDFNAFLQNFGVEAAPGAPGGAAGVTQIEMMGRPAFARAVGEYAAMSDKQEAVANFKVGANGGNFANALGQLGQSVLSESDFLVYFDVAKLAPLMQPALDEAIVNAKREMEMAGPQAKMFQQFVDAYAEAIRTLLSEGQAAAIGAKLDQPGVALSFAAQFKAGSTIAQGLANVPKKAPSFNRLPNRPYFFAVTMNNEAVPIYEWAQQMVEKMGDSPFAGIIRSSLALGKARETQQAFYAPGAAGAAPSPSLFNAINVYVTDKPQELLASQKQALEQMNKLELAPGMTYTTTFTPNVMQVAGKQVDQYSVKFNLPPEAQAEMGPLGMMFMQPMAGYLVTTDQALIVTSGADPILLKEAIEAAGGQGKLEVDAGIAAMRKHLPPGRAMEGYVNVGTILQTAGTFMAMFAPQMQMQVPADLPPVGIGASVGGGGVLVREFIPMPVIKAVSDIARKFMNQMQGPGGPGGPAPAAGGNIGQAPLPQSKHLVQVSDANFESAVLKSNKPVLVDFWAVWGGPSKAQAPIVNELADQYAGQAVIAKLDIDANPQTPEKYGIEAIPTLLLFKDGKVVQKFVGLTAKDKIDAALKTAIN